MSSTMQTKLKLVLTNLLKCYLGALMPTAELPKEHHAEDALMERVFGLHTKGNLGLLASPN